jgi:hypothetical protein
MPAAFGANGKPLEAGGSFVVTYRYGAATEADGPIFTATRACRVLKVMARILGTAGSATIDLKKAPSGTAAASGTSLLAAAMAADATTNTNLTPGLTTTAADLSLAAGDSICLDVTGTLTSATGAITIELGWL